MNTKVDPRIVQQMLQLQLHDRNRSWLSGISDSPTLSFEELLMNASGGQAAGLLKLNDSAGSNPFAAGQVNPHPSLSKPSAYEPLIQQASDHYGVDSALIKAVIQAESSFNPFAESSAGAKGLMQLMDGTARSLGVSDSLDPEQNINGGTRYLAGLLDKYDGNEAVALAAYNAGPGRIDRLGITDEASMQLQFNRLPAETRNYVAKVLQLKQTYIV